MTSATINKKSQLRNVQIVAIRHGQAKKVLETDDDNDRRLTPKGREQAQALRTMLGEDFNPSAVIISGLPRTRETAEEVLGYRQVTVVELATLFHLSNEEDQRKCDEMFCKLMYSPLRVYFDHEHGETLQRYGVSSAQEVVDEIEAQGLNNGNNTVPLIGHAVLLPATLRELCPGDESLDELLLDMNMGECNAMRIDIGYDGEIVSFAQIVP